MFAIQEAWSGTFDVFSAPDDIAAADAAMQHAVSQEWFAFLMTRPFSFDIYCDSAAELKEYADQRKLSGAELPYDELEERRRHWSARGQSGRLRCRRPWMVSTYGRK